MTVPAPLVPPLPPFGKITTPLPPVVLLPAVLVDELPPPGSEEDPPAGLDELPLAPELPLLEALRQELDATAKSAGASRASVRLKLRMEISFTLEASDDSRGASFHANHTRLWNR
jgi:hypothetical protein